MANFLLWKQTKMNFEWQPNRYSWHIFRERVAKLVAYPTNTVAVEVRIEASPISRNGQICKGRIKNTRNLRTIIFVIYFMPGRTAKQSRLVVRQAAANGKTSQLCKWFYEVLNVTPCGLILLVIGPLPPEYKLYKCNDIFSTEMPRI